MKALAKQFKTKPEAVVELHKALNLGATGAIIPGLTQLAKILVFAYSALSLSLNSGAEAALKSILEQLEGKNPGADSLSSSVNNTEEFNAKLLRNAARLQERLVKSRINLGEKDLLRGALNIVELSLIKDKSTYVKIKLLTILEISTRLTPSRRR